MIIATMNDDGIQVGDVVELAAGGPAMTVQARSQNLVYCAWMADGSLHQGTFETSSLRRLRKGGTAARRQPTSSPSSDPLP
jgi:uncharacterized protein YodC (DUF2158 family)